MVCGAMTESQKDQASNDAYHDAFAARNCFCALMLVTSHAHVATGEKKSCSAIQENKIL